MRSKRSNFLRFNPLSNINTALYLEHFHIQRRIFSSLLVQNKKRQIFSKNFQKSIDKPSQIVYNIKVVERQTTREWRNWQTRTFEGRVVYTVRVQVPFLAPQEHCESSALFFCFCGRRSRQVSTCRQISEAGKHPLAYIGGLCWVSFIGHTGALFFKL